ncbi:outer membrane protein assembly factor BamD [Chitinophaga sp. GCM10012297]|uniref:Outer membrane protein assembly factor BamD n=1 Tax=Chitinophaga chungangae TaxID=2821488 RepID=A0ABS3Y8G8_9BACT|nr:outer membrane protein assembly factor BamD [Chitinophaga chungangae]MBO9150623.1 outer membrane protein assembly factor BamD [Chitinophaga chungangae]
MRKILLYTGLMAAVITSASCNRELRRIEKSNDLEKKLAYADKMYEKKKYQLAQTLYEEMIPVFKGTDKFEPLYYKYAYCSFYLKDYQQAGFHFKNYLEALPSSPRAQEIDYQAAYCYYKLSPKVALDQTNTMKAIASMQTFINTYPNSEKSAEASVVIDLLRRKLEQKEYNAAELYYNLGHYKAAGVSFKSLMRAYPDSEKSDSYKYMAIKSYYLYAKNSVYYRQKERYETVLTEYMEFSDRYPTSKLKTDAEKYYNLAKTNIKSLENEQNKEKSNQ